MKRQIIEIDQERCNGCGACAEACAEGAIAMIGGKATLIRDDYCDGLGNCLPQCPTGAIRFIEKDTVAFDEDAVRRHLAGEAPAAAEPAARTPILFAPAPGLHPPAGGCPGSAMRNIERTPRQAAVRPAEAPAADVPSELRQWPVQIRLVNTHAPYLPDADLLIAADCTAYAYAAFHRDFIRDHVTLIGCPKLDDNEYYVDKLAEILRDNPIHSITVVRMEVPCCAGIVTAVKKAMLLSETIVPYREVVVGIEGDLLRS